ncbi:hypothetical protein FISHEDRAFT_13986, partial [Fistulina hepatica ATCC 64428]
DVYDTTLPWWRAAMRRQLVKRVQRESVLVANLQAYLRSPWMDTYFVYASSLGTHTFFTILLPTFFFFGQPELGRGLIILISMGVYLTSFAKDLVCSPRPFAPPVQRLTIGTHHLEYGFPSTHSTNSVSIALFFYVFVEGLLTDHHISFVTYIALSLLLAVYAVTIVFGRLYTAMHSFTDCVAGVLMGVGIWWAHTSWPGIALSVSLDNPLSYLVRLNIGDRIPAGVVFHVGRGLGAGEWVEHWIHSGDWSVPLTLLPLCFIAVNQHPQPVDDCPCFEDAIAVGAVLIGALVARWGMNFMGWSFIAENMVMPGSGWVLLPEVGWTQVERTWFDVLLWWSVATAKMVFGILIVFAWRLLAKSLLHLILPPTFRLLSQVFTLPNRRFYTPATDYKHVPSEFASADGRFALHPIPSVIDLSSTAAIEYGGIGSGHNPHVVRPLTNSVARKSKQSSDMFLEKQSSVNRWEDSVKVKHYDADVLTKVFVYGGIAVLVCEVIPVLFDAVGWSVKSSI